MRRMIYFVILIAFACVGCGDAQDEFVGEPMIRYVGKCTDLTVTPGWQRVRLDWKNNVDPSIEKIKITWSDESTSRDTLIDGNLETCVIEHLGNSTYSFAVSAVDADNNISMVEEEYGRPFTDEHELVGGFSRVVSKFFPRKKDNKLILFFSDWQEGLSEVTLSYYKGDKKEIQPLTEEEVSKRFMTLENVNLEREVTVLREGKIEGCMDLVPFPKYVLDMSERTFNNDFFKRLRVVHNLEVVTDEFIKNCEMLAFDYDLTSLEDVLYFPNLKKLQLGGGRYNINPMYASRLDDEEASEYALRLLKESGVEIERYAQHYFFENSDFLTEKGRPDIDKLNVRYLKTTDWTIKYFCSEENNTAYDAKAINLLDDNSKTVWQPLISKTAPRTHELIIDMGGEQLLDGFKIVQDVGSGFNMFYLPSLIKVSLSMDNQEWDAAMFFEENQLGASPSEITILRTDGSKKARYIKLSLSDMAGFNDYGIILADVIPFVNN